MVMSAKTTRGQEGTPIRRPIPKGREGLEFWIETSFDHIDEKLEGISKNMVSQEDLAKMETKITEKISSELKPLHEMVGAFKVVSENLTITTANLKDVAEDQKEMRGALKVAKRVFYIGLSVGLMLLAKIAFLPDWPNLGKMDSANPTHLAPASPVPPSPPVSK